MQIGSSSQLSYRGNARYLNAVNPIYYYSRKYFNRMAGTTSKRIEPLSNELKSVTETISLGSASAWDINPKKSDKYVLFLHGMAQNISSYRNLYETILDKGLGIFALEYRGYGRNKNTTVSETKVKKDVAKAYKYLTEQKSIKPENITVMGHSMGGCLAVNLAKSQKDLNALILLAPITSYSKLNPKFILNSRLGMGAPSFINNITEKIKPLKWLFGQCFNSIEKMKEVETPTYIVQSKNDSVTTLKGATKLAKTAKARGVLEEYIMLSLGGHKVDSRKIEAVSGILDRLA